MSMLGPVPLLHSVDPHRVGGVLILTSACQAQVGVDLGLERKKKPIAGVTEDEPLQADQLCIPGGGTYRLESVEKYVAQALLGGQMLAEALIQAGVPESYIQFEHFSGRDDDPADVVRRFFADLPPSNPDAILYYSGPTDEQGRFALGWSNDWGFTRTALIGPEDVMPPAGTGDGPPGNRCFILEASHTARWLQPTPRTMGLAAWEGVAVFGGTDGPPLVRWLVGQSRQMPQNALFCPRPISIGSQEGSLGLLSLPCYEALFWGHTPTSGRESAKKTADLLWEIDAFTAPARGTPDQVVACEELLIRGGSRLLCDLLNAHLEEPDAQALMLTILKILHRLTIHAPEERWLGGMSQVLTTALTTIAMEGCPGTIYAAGLGLVTACVSVCESARKEICDSHWKEINHIVCSSLKGEHGVEGAAVAAQLVTQVVSVHALDHGEDARMLRFLQSALVAQWDQHRISAVQVACADALLFASMHCDFVKKQVLHNLAHTGALLPLIEGASSEVVAKVLCLLRSLAAVEPQEIVAQDLAQGTVEAIVHALSKHAQNESAQRWGLAALGAITKACPGHTAAAVHAGACECVIWPLGSELFVPCANVQREALFCAHSLLHNESACAIFRRPSSRLSGLIAAILARSLQTPSSAASELPLWAVRALECLSSSPGGGASAVEPFLEALLEVMLSPWCRNATVIAGACTLSHLTMGSPVAKDRLVPHRVQLQKELQRRANEAVDSGSRELGKELQDWARVIIDVLGDHKLSGIDEDAGDPPATPVDSEAGDEEDDSP